DARKTTRHYRCLLIKTAGRHDIINMMIQREVQRSARPTGVNQSEGRRQLMQALILSANDFEDSELLVPYYRLLEAGYVVDVAAEKKGGIRGMHGYEVQA